MSFERVLQGDRQQFQREYPNEASRWAVFEKALAERNEVLIQCSDDMEAIIQEL